MRHYSHYKALIAHETHAYCKKFSSVRRNIDDHEVSIQTVRYGQRKEFSKLEDLYLRNIMAQALDRSLRPKQGSTHKEEQGAEGNELGCVEGCG
eukprot:2062609-Heterocapsa_arctica.AAC.1